MLTMRIFPDPILRAKAKEIKDARAFADIVREMAETMYVSKGIGLAAPQVGISLRLFVVDVGAGLREFINPQIIYRSRARSRMEEGCLSVPGVNVTVSRPIKIKVRATDVTGASFTEEFEGLEARAIQHENDHLNGKMILDYLDPVRQFITSRRLKKKNHTETKRTCEVVCDDRKRHSKRA